MAFGGILGGLMSLMPGYIQGRQQAINDNWKDIQNYDTSFGHELDNSYKEQVMPYAIANQKEQAGINWANYIQWLNGLPYTSQAAAINNWLSPYYAMGAAASRFGALGAQLRTASRAAGNIPPIPGAPQNGAVPSVNQGASSLNPPVFNAPNINQNGSPWYNNQQNGV